MSVPRKDQVLVAAWVDADLAYAFTEWSRTRGGKSAALRALIRDAIGAPLPVNLAKPILAAVVDFHVRLTPQERDVVKATAAQKGMAPATWVRSLIRAHVSRRPQWGEFERRSLATVIGALGKIGSNVNQIARAMNVAVIKGEYPAGQGTEARTAAADVKRSISHLGHLVAHDLDYWGVSDPAKVTASPVRARQRR